MLCKALDSATIHFNDGEESKMTEVDTLSCCAKFCYAVVSSSNALLPKCVQVRHQLLTELLSLQQTA